MDSYPKHGAADEISEAFSKVVDDIRTPGQRINESTGPTAYIWFRNLLSSILDCALKDYHNVKVGIRKVRPPCSLEYTKSFRA